MWSLTWPAILSASASQSLFIVAGSGKRDVPIIASGLRVGQVQPPGHRRPPGHRGSRRGGAGVAVYKTARREARTPGAGCEPARGAAPSFVDRHTRMILV